MVTKSKVIRNIKLYELGIKSDNIESDNIEYIINFMNDIFNDLQNTIIVRYNPQNIHFSI
jgi:hypothetical protein